MFQSRVVGNKEEKTERIVSAYKNNAAAFIV